MEELQTLNITSKVENIALVEKMIDDICDSYKVGEENYGNILIALTEAVNNAITHGNSKDPEKEVKLSFWPTENALKFKIVDEGPGFDYENLPDPTSPENIEKPNGRGVFLMKNLADEVAFEDNGAVVELSFNHIVQQN